MENSDLNLMADFRPLNYSLTRFFPSSSNAESTLGTSSRGICHPMQTASRGNIPFTWDCHTKSDNVEISFDNMEVMFNRRYSNGTAVARCAEPMSNDQYYWELKMNYPVYGTDIMVGIGTPEATVAYLPERYVSRLGMDEQTWGFSRHGLFHHNGEKRTYAQKFDQGNVIGVHLDLFRGLLSFYKDRKHLGVACSGLKDKTLYAMASSTAASSGMQIVYASCFPSSLQFLCVSKLRKLVPNNKNVFDVYNVPPGLKQFLQTNLSWLLDKSEIEEDVIPSEIENEEDSNMPDPNAEDNKTKNYVRPEGIFINKIEDSISSLSDLSDFNDSTSPEASPKRLRLDWVM